MCLCVCVSRPTSSWLWLNIILTCHGVGIRGTAADFTTSGRVPVPSEVTFQIARNRVAHATTTIPGRCGLLRGWWWETDAYFTSSGRISHKPVGTLHLAVRHRAAPPRGLGGSGSLSTRADLTSKEVQGQTKLTGFVAEWHAVAAEGPRTALTDLTAILILRLN